MFFYEMLYTGIGTYSSSHPSNSNDPGLTAPTAQFIAAYAPNPPFAALLIPVVIAVLVTFSGVLVSPALLRMKHLTDLSDPLQPAHGILEILA